MTNSNLKPFKFWCQTTLPLVYDDSLSYYELLCKVVSYLNKVVEDLRLNSEDNEKLWAAINTLDNYVKNYLAEDVVVDAVNNKLDELIESGEIGQIIGEYLSSNVVFNFIPNKVIRNSEGDPTNSGSGDCCVITHKGKNYMVDSWDAYDMREVGIPYLKNKGITEFEGIFITHYHADHFQGVVSLLNDNSFTIKKLYLPPKPDFNQPFFDNRETDNIEDNYNYFMGVVANSGVSYSFVASGYIELNDELMVKVFNADYTYYYNQTVNRPEGTSGNSSDDGIYSDYNNMSVCYQFEYNGLKALFSGDIGYSAMVHLMPVIEKVDLWSINHHSHNNYINNDFYSKLSPTIGVFQDTYNQYWNNPYTNDVYNRIGARYLRARNVEVYGTLGELVSIMFATNSARVAVGDSHYDWSMFKFYGEQFKQAFNKFGDFAYPYPIAGDANNCRNGLFRLPSGSTHVPIEGQSFLIADFTDIAWEEVRFQIGARYVATVGSPLWYRSYSKVRGDWEPWCTLKGEQQWDVVRNAEYFTPRSTSERVSSSGGVCCVHIYSTLATTIAPKTGTIYCTLPEHLRPWGFSAGVALAINGDNVYHVETYVDSTGVVKLWCADELPEGTNIEGTLTIIPRY